MSIEDLPNILAKISASAFITGCIFLIGVIVGALAQTEPLLIASLGLFGIWTALAVLAGAAALIAAIWIDD